jgi:hypothetical protein
MKKTSNIERRTPNTESQRRRNLHLRRRNQGAESAALCQRRQEQEMKKTLNAQRPTLNAQCNDVIPPLSVGRWTLDVGRLLFL